MYPILFSIGKINVYTHGTLMALGSIAGGLIIYYLAKKEKLRTALVFDLIVFSVLGGLIGARLAYFIFYYYQFADWREIFFIWYGGLVSFGGIIGGLLAAYLLLKKKRQPIWRWFDVGIIGLMVGWAIGRIGCLLINDSPGLTTISKWAIWGRYPVALFESIWSLAVAAIAFGLFKQKKILLDKGMIFSLGLILYFIGRFFIEFLRDEETLFWQIKPGQLTSLIFIIILIVWLILSKINKKNIN